MATSPSSTTRSTWWWLIIVPVVAAAAVAITFAFTSNDTTAARGGAGGAHGTAVQTRTFSFNPPALVVARDAQISVTNGDGTTHTLTAVGGAFDAGRLDGGATATSTDPSARQVRAATTISTCTAC